MSGSNRAVRLRPHHGMCLAYFVGEGYSEGFSAHMGRVLSSLVPGTAVELTVAADAVCAQCPNDHGGLCETAEKVRRYDRAVLERCGLEAGETLPFGAFTALVQERILAPGLRREICGECQWDALCAQTPSRWAEHE